MTNTEILDQLSEIIKATGTMTWQQIKTEYPEQDEMALAKAVRSLARTGRVSMTPPILVNSTVIRHRRITIEVCGTVHEAADLLALIPDNGMRWDERHGIFPEHDAMVIDQLLELAVAGKISMDPMFIKDDMMITRVDTTVLSVAGDVLEHIPSDGTTFKALRAIKEDTHEGELVVKLAALQAGGHIKITPRAPLNDESRIERITLMDKVASFVSRRTSA